MANTMRQSEFEEIKRDRRKARENARVQVVIGIDIASH